MGGYKNWLIEEQARDDTCCSVYEVGGDEKFHDPILDRRIVETLFEQGWVCKECGETLCELFFCQVEDPQLLCETCHGQLHADNFGHGEDRFAVDSVMQKIEDDAIEEEFQRQYQEHLKDEIRRKSYP